MKTKDLCFARRSSSGSLRVKPSAPTKALELRSSGGENPVKSPDNLITSSNPLSLKVGTLIGTRKRSCASETRVA